MTLPYVLRERAALMDLLIDAMGDLVQAVSIDMQSARPSPGKVSVLIDPPELEYESWTRTPTVTWRLTVMAGTMATQTAGMDLILTAIDRLAAIPLNISSAIPVTVNIGSGMIAGYQITLNPLELDMEETNG